MEQSNLAETLQRIDAVITEKKAAIKLGEDLKFLMSNPQFKRVILDGYIDIEAKKLFNVLVDPSGVSPFSAEVIQLKLEAISHLKGYIGTPDFPGAIEAEAEQAPMDIYREEEYRKEVTATFDRSEG